MWRKTVGALLVGLWLAAPAIADEGTWSEAERMGLARLYHSATLLPDGRVLVNGGYGNVGYVPTATLYDPALGTWVPTGVGGEGEGPALRLLDGRILAIGAGQIYNPATGRWSAISSSMYAHYDSTATLLLDGRVLVAEGATAELYDPVMDTWAVTGGMVSHVRYHSAAARLQDGRVLLTGGDNMFIFDGSSELYDPASGTWTLTGGTSHSGSYSSATTLQDGRVLVVNYSYAELYDPGLDTWTATGAMLLVDNEKSGHTATLLDDGRVLVNSEHGAELFQPASDDWVLASPYTALHGHAAVRLADGRVLVTGGSWHSNNYQHGRIVARAALWAPTVSAAALAD